MTKRKQTGKKHKKKAKQKKKPTKKAGKKPSAAADGDFTVVKRCRDGPMAFNRNDIYVGRSLDLYGEYSEGEAKVFRELVQPGWTALDVGANVGAFTVTMAKAVGPTGTVVAFEPQPVVFRMLRASVALNKLANVECRHAAVGRRKGKITVPLIDPRAAYNFGGVALGDQGQGKGADGERRKTKRRKVDVVTLDGLKLTACHFVKIDVEGMEQDVIAGARRTIGRFRPLLYVENDRAEKAVGLIRAIDGLGYKMFWHAAPLFNPNNFAGNRENVFGRIVSINMLCVPAELNPRVSGMPPVAVP